MIQVSTPTANVHEGSYGEPPKNPGTPKKEALGVFAKLLAGLLGNTRKDAAGLTEKAETGENPEEAAAGTGEKISSRKRKKASSLLAEQEAGAAFFLHPGGLNPDEVSLSAEGLAPEGSGGPGRGFSLKKAGEIAEKEPAPVSPELAGTREGEDSPGLAEALKAGVPDEAAAEALPAGDTPPDPGTDTKDPFRDRKIAGKEDSRIMAESAAAENSRNPPVSWGGMKDFSGLRPERESPRESRSAEGRDRRRERLGLDIRDFRTSFSGTSPESPAAGSAGGEGIGADLLVELSPPGERSPGDTPFGERGAGDAKGSSASFESLLARELRQDLSGDIVRSAQFILRDGGEGTIRLSLRPESLGNVKIRLEMAENKIIGHIIVENDETLRAFEQEIRSLEQAFLDAGFDGADLDTALAYGDGQRGGSGEKSGAEEDSFFFLQTAAASYDAAPEWGEEAGGNSGYGISRQINMLI